MLEAWYDQNSDYFTIWKRRIVTVFRNGQWIQTTEQYPVRLKRNPAPPELPLGSKGDDVA